MGPDVKKIAGDLNRNKKQLRDIIEEPSTTGKKNLTLQQMEELRKKQKGR